MKRFTILAVAICLIPALALAGDADSWFDMPNCDICKHMLTKEGMLNDIGWDIHNTAMGAMTVTTVPAQHSADWAAAKAAMHATGEKVAHGDAANLCNFCKSLGALMASGKMTMEEFQTIGGEVSLFSSTDKATVEAIHKHFERSQAEMKKMEAEMSASGR